MLNQSLAGLGVAACLGFFCVLDATNSTALAQTRERCIADRVESDFLEGHKEVLNAKRDLRDLIAAAKDKYTDLDFGYDPKSNKERRRYFTEALLRAQAQFDELIAGLARNHTEVCRVCGLTEVYDRAKAANEGERVTLEELERFPELFSDLAENDRELKYKQGKLKEAHDRGMDENNYEVRVLIENIETLQGQLRQGHDRLRTFREGSERDATSPLMRVELERYTCEFRRQ